MLYKKRDYSKNPPFYPTPKTINVYFPTFLLSYLRFMHVVLGRT